MEVKDLMGRMGLMGLIGLIGLTDTTDLKAHLAAAGSRTRRV